jgi:hypothetical protein
MTTNIFFKSAAHKTRLLEAMRRIDKIENGRFDPEYGAACYILTADTATWNKAQEYVSRQGILFEELLNEVDFSGGYQVLIQFAANLFNEHAMPAQNAVELMRLDDDNFRIALSALVIRRYSLRVDDLK